MINLRELNALVEDKYVNVQKHPIHDLYIYNYSQKTQYERYWTPLTLKCRGLILDGKGNIIAKSFDKFFNYEELSKDQIPDETFEVFEKMDGSLILMFNYNNEWIFASRGSFTSNQVNWAEEIFDKKYNNTLLNINNTYIFELIHPENRIVCDYKDRKELILLGINSINRKTELPYVHVIDSARFIGCKFTQKHYLKNISDIKYKIKDDKEGFVIRFENGFRMKIKGDEYVRLHRIITNISNKTIWEHLKDNKSIESLIENVPDEFYQWVTKTILEFENKYRDISNSIDNTMSEIMRQEYKNRAEFAKVAKLREHSPCLFALYDKKYESVKNYIWKLLKPKFEKPFNNISIK